MSRTVSSAFSIAGVALCAVALSACGSSGSGNSTSASAGSSSNSSSSSTANAGASICGGKTGSGNVTVGYADFAENQALASIYAAALDKCGYTATTRGFKSREIYYPALTKDQIQVVPDYAATLTDFINQQKNGANAPTKASGDINKTMQALKSELPSSLTALTPAAATDKNAFAVKQSFATAHHITTLSQLATYSKSHPLELGGPGECPTRPYCEPGLKSKYGMKFSGFKTLDAGGPLTIAAIKSGKVDVGLVFTSDPTVKANGLVVLTDDKMLQASDNIVPIVNSKLANAAASSAIDAVQAKLDENTLIQINQAVSAQHAKPSRVAQQFVQQIG